MAVVSLLVFLVLCCYLVHPHSAQGTKPSPLDCPHSFTCGKLGNLGYPFTNYSCPRPGRLRLSDCDGNTSIHLKEGGRGLRVENISQSDIIFINDPVLEHQLHSKNCHYFEDLALPETPSYYFHVIKNLTMIKCNHSSPFPFLENSLRVDCSLQNYSIYYNHQHNDSMDLPHCSIIHLPSNQHPPKGNTIDLFTLLSAQFSLQVQINSECASCHDLGGECEHDSEGKFHCAKALANHGSSLHLKIIGILAAGVGFLLGVLLFFLRKKCSPISSLLFWKTKGESYENIENFLLAFGSMCPRRYSYLDIKNMTDSLKDKLGEGGFGGVYKGKLRDSRLVAVKVLKGSKGNGEDFINEVSSISRTSHVNIVSLLGFCFEGPKRALVYEFMPNGSLEKFIYEKGNVSVNRTLKWETLFKIAVGIARGLEYLHLGCNTRILHFDIKPHNILLDEEFCPKISDFGLAKVCPRKDSIVSMLGARGTIGYIAPEVACRNFGGVSHKSDVYSYGMMVLEMVGGRRNVDCEAGDTSQVYFPHWIYNRVVSEEELGLHGIVNLEDKECAKKMVMVSLWCIQTEPSKRPSMSRVVDMLEGKVESLENPPKPF